MVSPLTDVQKHGRKYNHAGAHVRTHADQTAYEAYSCSQMTSQRDTSTAPRSQHHYVLQNARGAKRPVFGATEYHQLVGVQRDYASTESARNDLRIRDRTAANRQYHTEDEHEAPAWSEPQKKASKIRS